MYCVNVLASIFSIKLHKKTYIEDRAVLLNRWGMALLRKYSVKVINWGLIH